MINTTHRLTSGVIFVFFGLILAIAVNLTAPLIARAQTSVRYAAPDAQGSGDCSSWADACTLQTALGTASSGDEIWVQEGVHLPGTTREDTFTLKSGVALYGGFAGSETLRDQRDWQDNPTILSGDIDNNDTNDDGNDIAETSTDIQGANTYHVVTGDGTDNTAVLDGFIVTAGKANGTFPHECGGGMFNNNSSPALTDVTFSGNAAEHYGGGMYNKNSSSPTLTNVTFSGNTAIHRGGGMVNSNSSPTLTNVTFSGNTTIYYGGGMYNYESSPILTNVTFSSNSATWDGGGMVNYKSSPTLTDVTFSSNTATNHGGGMVNDESSPTLTDVTFSDNTATNQGGGMYNSSSIPTLTDVTFSGNTATNQGGGMYNSSSIPTLTDVTFSGNTATEYGGGMANYNNSNPTLINVTFSGNSAYVGGGMYNIYNSSPMLINVTFSGNTATEDGGGMYNRESSSPTLTNVTFSGNNAIASGGGMYNNGSSNPTLTNVIIWGDSAPTSSEIHNDNSTPSIAYSDIQSCGGSGTGWDIDCGTDGGGNIDADPRFIDSTNGNLRLQLTSPAIDAGNNAAVPSGITTDLDDNPRFVDIPSIPDTGNGTAPIVDMGAYEAYKILYATSTAQGSGNCTSWANACTLQTALTTAMRGQEIWVQEGVHLPGTTRDDTFTLQRGVALYGGFDGTESSLDQRDWQTNPTILSGDIDKNDTNDDGNNIAETPADIQGDNAYHVVTGGGTDDTAVLDGFIITAGQANGIDPENRGGGMVNYSSSPTLTDVIFSGNTASRYGGGMVNYDNSSPTLTDVTFSGNTASNDGGGMYNYSSSPTLTDVTFSDNTASWDGGGMFNYESSPTLTDVTFSGNAADYGGGMYNTYSSNPTLTDVTFSDNAADDGGGMVNSSSSPTLTDVTFNDNAASSHGGGMYNTYSSNPTLTDVTFSLNTASKDGGGMYNFKNSSPTLTDVTFNDNAASWHGGGMVNDYYSSPTLTNVTFSGNTASRDGGGMYNEEYSSPTLGNVTFSGNTASRDGGGMVNDYYSRPTLGNVTFSGNTATHGGGMYNNSQSSPTLTNVTFSDNTATNHDGGGMYNNSYSRPTLTNVIMWGDSAPTGPEIYNESSTPFIAYSDIQSCGGSGTGWDIDCGTDDGGNIDADPLFVDAAEGNLRLQPTSPAIDAGKNEAVPDGITTDLDGNPRFVDILTIPDTGNGTAPIVDMGAYEAQNTPPVSDAGPDQTVDTGDVVTLDGTGSSDPDGDLPLTYQWAQTGGTTVTLSNPTAVNPTFTAPDDPDVLTFTLTVSDSLGMSDPTPDDVVITVETSTYYFFFPLIFK